MELVQSIVLSDWFLILVLGVVFVGVTAWSLSKMNEYRGYALGWLVALFFIIVFSSLMGPQIDQTQQVMESDRYLNLFQVIISTFLGIGTAVIIGVLSAITRLPGLTRALRVAAMTAILLILLFLMFVSDMETRRMISIYALSFGMTAVSLQIVLVSLRRRRQPSVEVPEVPQPIAEPRITALDEPKPTPQAHRERLNAVRQHIVDNSRFPNQNI